MASVFLLLQFAVAVLCYCGFFPALYFMARGRSWLAYGALGLVAGAFLTPLMDSPLLPYLAPVGLAAFVFPGVLLIALASKKRNRRELRGENIRRELWRVLYLVSHLPTVVLGVVYFAWPGAVLSLEELLLKYLQHPDVVKSAESLGDPQILLGQFARMVAEYFPGLWILDLSFRLFTGAYILTRIKLGKKPVLQGRDFLDWNYPEWPVWLVATALAGLLAGWTYPEYGVLVPWCGNALLVLTPFYFIRGVSALWRRWRVKPLSPYLKFLYLLLLLLFWQYIALSVTLIGLLDTWVDFTPKEDSGAGRT